MIGPCFVTVGANTVKLSELKVTGYEGSEYYLTEELGFSASFQRRASNGMPYATYVWTDSTDDMETWNGGKWLDASTMEEVTALNDVILKPGDGLWFTTPDLHDCTGFSLTTSGAVLKGSQAFELNAGGKIGVANMMPASVKLSEIEIQGYEDSEYYLTEELGFSMSMQSLKSNGMPLVTYVWTDSTDDMETWDGGKWLNASTMEEITSENDVTVAAGEGFWATCPDLHDCEKFTFVVPGVLTE